MNISTSVKTPMTNRRPLVMPTWYSSDTVTQNASYFSESIATQQPIKEKILNEMYRPNFGAYKYSNAKVLYKQRVDDILKGVACCKFSPDGRYLILGLGNGSIHIFSVPSKVIDFRLNKVTPKKITALAFAGFDSPNQFFASTIAGMVLSLVKTTDANQTDTWESQTLFNESENEINAMDRGEKNTLTTAGKDAIIRHYDIASGKLIREFDKADLLCDDVTILQGHSKRICSLKYSGLGSNIFVTGGWDNSIKIWDVRCPNQPVNSIYGFHITGDSLDVLNNVIVCGQWSSKDSLQLLDQRTCKVIEVINPNNQAMLDSGGFINSAKFLRGLLGGAQGDLIITGGSGTCAMEIISIRENVVLHSAIETNSIFALDSFENCVAFGGYCENFTLLEFIFRNKELKMIGSLDYFSESSIMKSDAEFITKADPVWNKTLKELREIWENIPMPSVPTEEDWFMKNFLQEVTEFSGTGPYSIFGEKLSRYLRSVETFPETLEGRKLPKEGSTSGLKTYHTYDINNDSE